MVSWVVQGGISIRRGIYANIAVVGFYEPYLFAINAQQ